MRTTMAGVAAALLCAMACFEMARAADMMPQRLTGVPFTEVKFADGFWAPKLKVNREVTIPHDLRLCRETGRIDNFAKAAGLMQGDFKGIYFDDSDVYKVIEGAAYALATHPDPKLEKEIEDIIALIAAAQWKDGYLNTYYTLKAKDKRWTNLGVMHELYCGGHMIEAAVAHHRATGRNTLLDVARKWADHVDSIFGPDKRHDVCGHEEVELALVKLYHLTGEKRYLNLAKFFIDERGHDACGRKLYGQYAQDHKPVRQQTEIVGHAVRAMYLLCGVADVAAATGDASYLPALEALWDSVALRKMYITGGIGSRHSGEAFGDDYELPNATAYCETCAAIGNALWNHRMNLLYGDAKFADVVERVIYNGFLSGVSLSGDRFFYVNPLESRGRHHRQAWYGCACCPSNVVRFLPSLPGYVYATTDQALYVNLYVASTAKARFGQNAVSLVQETRYPWDGAVKLTIGPERPAEFDVFLRVPGWCRGASVKVNGVAAQGVESAKGYLRLRRTWRAGDVVELDLPMPIERVRAHPKVKDNIGRVAIQRGPVVYCLEGADNGGRVHHLSLPPDAALSAEYRGDLLGGVMVIRGRALAHHAGEAQPRNVEFTAIPYFAWDNREAGPMLVWIPEDPKLVEPVPAPTIASRSRVSASFAHARDSLDALNDQIEPKNSSDHGIPRMTWWDHKGTEEWVQYDFSERQRVSEVHVYWFDDTGRGQCRVPQSWKLLYRDAGQWKPVAAKGDFGVEKDRFNAVQFEPVDTDGLRIVVQLQKGFSGGILEWKVR